MRGSCCAMLSSLEPGISTTSLSHFMVTQVCDGRTSLSKREEEGKNENNPLELLSTLTWHFSSLSVSLQAATSQPTQSPHTTSHIQRTKDPGYGSSLNLQMRYLYPVMGLKNYLKNYHCHLSRLNNVSVWLCCGWVPLSSTSYSQQLILKTRKSLQHQVRHCETSSGSEMENFETVNLIQKGK